MSLFSEHTTGAECGRTKDRCLDRVYFCSDGSGCFLCNLSSVGSRQCAHLRRGTAGMGDCICDSVWMGLRYSASDV